MRFFLSFLLLITTAQTNAQQTPDYLMERIVLRNIDFHRDNSINVHGAILLKFERSVDSIKMEILYNSISYFDQSIQKQINNREIESIKKLPKTYRVLVPVYVTQLTEQGIKMPPAAETIQAVEEKIKTIKGEIRMLKAVEIILYPTMR